MTNRINTLRRFYLWSFFNPSLDSKKSLSQGSRLSWAFQTSRCLFKLRKLKIKETWRKSHLCKTITLENIVFDWACHISRVHLHTFTSFICMFGVYGTPPHTCMALHGLWVMRPSFIQWDVSAVVVVQTFRCCLFSLQNRQNCPEIKLKPLQRL